MDFGVLNVTLASSAQSWNEIVNVQLVQELALNNRITVTGFVPRSTEEQRKHARMLHFRLVDAKFNSGFSEEELLAYPPDDLIIDILVMHSYGGADGRQGQIIKATKNCKWVLVVHTIREELGKFVKKSASSAAVEEPEYELQVNLCEMADLVVAVGPQVAEAVKAALRYSGKQNAIFTLTPNILSEFLGVRHAFDLKSWDENEKFRVLISGSVKYFDVKGCDIAAKAISLLQDSSYHLIIVVRPNDDPYEIASAMHDKGISLNQLTVRTCPETTERWRRLLCEVDLLIQPTGAESFGMSGLRAISADLPLLVSTNCGLGIAMKSLPSGESSVVDSDEPDIWANRLKEVRAKGPRTCYFQAKQLRSEYTERFNWREQVNNLVEIISEIGQPSHASKTGGFENSMKLPVNSVYFGSTEEQATETNVLDEGQHLRMIMKGVQEMGLQEEAKDEKKRGKEKAFSLTYKGLKVMDDQALNRLYTNILDIPSHVYNRVCSRLNVKDDLFFRDFRLLGEVLGYPKQVINRLSYGSMSNTTHEILQMWSTRSWGGATVGRLIEMLMMMRRRDVVEILQKCTNLSSEVTEIPLSIYREVCSRLDTRDDILSRDYRMLADILGCDRDLLLVWEQPQNSSRPNPTNELLKLWSFDSGDEATVQRLIELLQQDDLKRMDVVKILEDWVFGG